MTKRGSRGLHLDYHALHQRYLAGESGVSLAREVGIDFTGLYASWRRRGLPIRSAAEAARLTVAQDPARASGLIRSATAARRGTTDPMEVKIARARTREARQLGRSPLEDVFAAALDALGISYRRQAAIGPYNVDFAFDDRMLAIEISGGGHNSRVSRNRKARDAYLADAGWRVVWVERRRVDWLAVAIKAALDDWNPV